MSVAKLLRAAMAAALVLILSLSAAAETVHDVPVLDEEALFGEALVLMDADTGEVLYSKNANTAMFPASTTKIMTLLLALESDIDLDSIVTVPREAGQIPEGSSTIPVRPKDKLSFRDLLYGFMLNSGNDGANAIAVLVDGSIDSFVKRMNRRAKQLGCENTHFVNAHGYHNENHYTTAMDLTRITREAMKNELFRQIVAAPEWKLTLSRDGKKRTLEIPSRVLMVRESEKFYYADCTGVKTGFHSKAGYCFVATASRNGMNLLCVTLRCPKENQKWYDAARLFEYGFSLYEPVRLGELFGRVAGNFAQATIENAAEDDPDGGRLTLDVENVRDGGVTRMLVADSQVSLSYALDGISSSMSVSWNRELTAPVQAGEVLGTLSCALPGGASVTADLVAPRDVAVYVPPTPTPTPAPAKKEKRQKPTAEPAEASVGEQPPRQDGAPAGLVAALIALAVLIVALLVAAHVREKKRRERLRRRRMAARRRAQAVRTSGVPRRSPLPAEGSPRPRLYR